MHRGLLCAFGAGALLWSGLAAASENPGASFSAVAQPKAPPVAFAACTSSTTWSCFWVEGTRSGNCPTSRPATNTTAGYACTCGPRKGKKVGVTVGCQ
jgi:hypothetical protein